MRCGTVRCKELSSGCLLAGEGIERAETNHETQAATAPQVIDPSAGMGGVHFGTSRSRWGYSPARYRALCLGVAMALGDIVPDGAANGTECLIAGRQIGARHENEGSLERDAVFDSYARPPRMAGRSA